MRQQAAKPILIVLGLFALFIGLFCLYTVNEAQRAIVIRLGQFVPGQETSDTGKPLPLIMGPGLHFKMPFVDSVETFDSRIQMLSIEKSRIPTEEKKEVIVDLFVKWRIVDFGAFYTSTTGKKARAERLLKERVIDGLRAEIGRRKINDVISNERSEIMQRLREGLNTAAKNLGLTAIDVRIVRIELPQEVSEAVFNLMRAERQRVATFHRSQGRSRAEAIRAEADANVTVIYAQADKQSKTLMGEGDASAAKIYAKAYSQDTDFYQFYRSLEAYKETFRDNKDMFVVKPNTEFFRFFNQSQAGKVALPSNKVASPDPGNPNN